VSGSWLLHQYFKDAPLDFFVMFSSNSALLSSPLMGSYAAANTFMDTLAHHRRALGLPALSINWGTWGEVGMLLDFGESGRQAALRGVGAISTQQGLTALERLIQADTIQAAVMSIDWKKWQESYPIFKEVPLLKQLMNEKLEDSREKADSHRLSLTDLMSTAVEQRPEMLRTYLTGITANIMGSSPGKLDIRQPITNMGLDSLMAVELKNRIEMELKIVLPMMELLQGPTILQLTEELMNRLPGIDSSPEAITIPNEIRNDSLSSSTTSQLLSSIDELSDDQVDTLLDELLSEQESNDE
jgi:acyl carrier protein